MKTILHYVHIHAAPSTVYNALTTERGLSGWWTTKVKVREGQGGVIEFTFHGDFHPKMKQTKLVPNELATWECVAGHDNWLHNTFSFALEETDGEAALMFTQHYAQELADDVYGTYNFNWGWYLASLKELCETGTGKPFQPPA